MRERKNTYLAVEEEHHAKERLHQVVVGLRHGLRDGQQVVGQCGNQTHQLLRVQHAFADYTLPRRDARTLLALREKAFDENHVENSDAEVGVVDKGDAALQQLQHHGVVHLVEEDAESNQRVCQQDGRGLRLGVIPAGEPHGEVWKNNAGEEGRDASRIVEGSHRPHDGGELGAAVEEEVVGTVTLFG